MGNETTKVVLDLDNTEFVDKLKESLGLMEEFGAGEALGPLVGILTDLATGPIGLILAGVAALKVALDLSKEAEKINQINQSFENLAKSVGLSADAMKDKLLVAARGLIDDTDLLESANKAIVGMGENAARIPEILELARKATAVFGGDFKSNFDSINQALAAGNTRMLRHYGIIVDATKAQDEYAKSLGISRDYLDSTGQRIAVMNAALEQGKTKFADVDESVLKTTNSLKQIWVTLKDIGEIAILAWDKVAGPTVSKAIEGVANWFHNLKISAMDAFGSGTEQSKAHTENLEITIAKLKEQIPLYEKAFNSQKVSELNAQLKAAEAELNNINAAQKKSVDLEKEKAAASGGESGKGVDYSKLLKEKTKFEADLAKIHKERVDSDLKTETDADIAEQSVHERSTAIMAEADAKWAQTKKQMNDLGIHDEQSIAKARVDVYQRANNEVLQNERNVNAERIKALKNLELANQNTAKGISASFAKNGEMAKQNFKNMAKAGDTAFNAIGSNAKTAFEDLGKGSANAGQALKGFFFGAIGDIAEQQGELMLLMGIWPPNPVAIAAGGALIALGAALKSQGQSSGGSISSGGGGGAGGGSSALDTSTQASQVSAPQAQAQEKKSVTIAIQGNYFETDQTRTRLMDMIREAGDFTDFQLKQIGQP